jgi:hypothetical protein
MTEALKTQLSLFSTATPSVSLISKVLENILKSPEDDKFRKLKSDKVEPKLSKTKGALEFLLAAGFTKTETHYVLPTNASLDTVRQAHKMLEAALPASTAHVHSNGGGCCSDTATKASAHVHSNGGGCCSDSASTTKKQSSGCCSSDASSSSKKGGCCSSKPANESDEQREFREKREAKEELLKKIAIAKKDKAQDVKFVVGSTANNLKFGSTKISMPPPSACKTG